MIVEILKLTKSSDIFSHVSLGPNTSLILINYNKTRSDICLQNSVHWVELINMTAKILYPDSERQNLLDAPYRGLRTT